MPVASGYGAGPAQLGPAPLHWPVMLLLLSASPTPTPTPVVASSTASWLPYVIGAASALVTALVVQLVVQFWVVPKVETRKRREDRWERDVRELYSLVAISLPELANDAWAAQALYIDASSDPELDAKELAKEQGKATRVYGSFIGSEMDMQIDRVLSINPKASELAKLEKLYKGYEHRSVFVRGLPKPGTDALEELDKTWGKEGEARKALTAQVKLLAYMRRPPR